MPTPWSPEENRLFEELKEEGRSLPQIRKIFSERGFNRSYDSFENKARRDRKNKWRRQQKSKLAEPVAEIPSAPEILIPPKLTRLEFPLASVLDEIIKTVWLFDSHFPFNLNINPLLKFCGVFRPHIFGFGGDNWSLDCISHWNQGHFKNWGMDQVIKRFNDEAAAFKRHIGQFLEAMPDAHFVYIMGNHEAWIDRFAEEFPQTQKPTIHSVLGEYASRVQIIPQGGIYKIGKLYFAHGDQFGSQNPPKQALDRTNGKSIVIGHHHTAKVWSSFSLVDELDKHIALQSPCFCGLAPEYGRGKPNQWNNGFFTACIKRKSGNFAPFIQMAGPKGNFITQDGTEYY